MKRDHLKVVASNNQDALKKEPPAPKVNPETSTSMLKVRNFTFGIFYLLWILSLPATVALAAEWATGSMKLASNEFYPLAGSAILIFVAGIFFFGFMKVKPTDASPTIH